MTATWMLGLALATSSPKAPTEPSWSVPAAHGAGLMLGMRLSVSLLWSEAYDFAPARDLGRGLRDAYTLPPEFDADAALFASDGDPWALNAVGHGLFGAEVYLRFRQCRHSAVTALLATAVASTAWEYGLEAPHQRPSAVDLVWTPLGGALLGEGRWRLYRWLRGSDDEEPGTMPTVFMWMVDPLGELERTAGSGC